MICEMICVSFRTWRVMICYSLLTFFAHAESFEMKETSRAKSTYKPSTITINFSSSISFEATYGRCGLKGVNIRRRDFQRKLVFSASATATNGNGNARARRRVVAVALPWQIRRRGPRQRDILESRRTIGEGWEYCRVIEGGSYHYHRVQWQCVRAK